MNLDKLTPMMKQYVELKEEYPDTIIFYRLGDFYEMFFEDALTASKILEIALTGRNAGLEEKVPMCGVPYHSSEAYIKKLVDNGYKVGICEQLSAPQAGEIVKRGVIKVITPGTIEDKTSNNYNYLMYVDDTQDGYYYLAVCDLLTGKLKAVKTNKDLNHLYQEILSYQVKEIVVRRAFDAAIFNKLLKTYKVLLSFSDDNTKVHPLVGNIKDDFKRAFNNMLGYVENMQKSPLNYFMDIEYENSNYMKLDFSSKFNLELVTTIKNNNKYGTLFWFLDKTKTAMGSRLLKEFIEAPLINEDMIHQRQAFVEALLDKHLTTKTIAGLLSKVYDIARIAGKMGLNTINVKEMLWLKNSLDKAASIKDELLKIEQPSIDNYLKDFDLVLEAYHLIANNINEDYLDDNTQTIKDGVNKKLDQYRQLLRNSTDWLVAFENKERERTGIKNLKIKYNKIFGYYIEVSNAHKHMVKDEFGYVRKQTLTNAERYINSELKEQESLILNAQDNINQLEQELFLQLKEELRAYTQRLQALAKKLAYLDVMQAFSVVSNDYGYSKPVFSNDVIDIKDSFHPIIKKLDHEHPFVNNDYLMDQDTSTIIITGPNMGGKSTYMRQLAIISIMAQIGCYVPAMKAQTKLFEQIFTRIGASDDLINGQSTFMVEMLEAGNAILNADTNSLVLFDEIGRGTATFDGMAIAQAMIEYLTKHNQAKVLFSTHYHELINLADKYDTIKNYHASVIEKAGAINFTYKIKPGSIDKSYGIHVAKLANLPQELLDQADELLLRFENQGSHSNDEAQVIRVKEYLDKGIVEQLQGLDINNLKPIEALSLLAELQTQVGELHE